MSGQSAEVLGGFSVSLPNKHGRGGQSALRFARLRLEKRHNYLLKVAEHANQYFLSQDNGRPLVHGIVIGGCADMKQELVARNYLDERLSSIVVKVVETSYGGRTGFNQAIGEAADVLKGVRIVEERRVLSRFFGELAVDSGKAVYGAKETVEAMECGSAETLIIWAKLPLLRSVGLLYGEQEVEYLETEAEVCQEDEVVDCRPLLDWIVDEYKKHGAKLEIVSDTFSEGAQFCKSFGGIGAILRYSTT